LQGRPYEQYGVMEPISSYPSAPHNAVVERVIPRASLDSRNPALLSDNQASTSGTHNGAPIDPSESGSHSRSQSGSRIMRAFRRATVPKMQDVVKRSLTILRKSKGKETESLPPSHDQEKKSSLDVVTPSPLPTSSQPLSGRHRFKSATIAGKPTRRATEMTMSTTSTLTPLSRHQDSAKADGEKSLSTASSSTMVRRGTL